MIEPRRTLAVAVILAVVSGVVGTTAQQPEPTFTSHAELVVLHVTVKDRRGAYVTDLAEDAFTVYEDERSTPISVFTAVDSPATVGLVIDGSGSMHEGQRHVVAAASAFAAASHPQDDLFAVTFNEHVRDVLPASAPFTSEAAVLRAALEGSIRAYGRTALYDAIRRGLAYVENGRHPRRVLILVADGGDNASVATFEEILREAQASNAAIYAVGVVDPADGTANRGRLRELARATGGEAFFPRRVDEVPDVLRRIAQEIRHTYTIGFVPPPVSQDGEFRRLRVEARASDGRSLRVRTREGYRAGVARPRS